MVVAAIVVATSLVAGCGGGGGEPTVGDACAKYAANDCALFETCAPGLNWIFGATNMADCVSVNVTACQAAAASAHSGFTPSVIDACANAIAAADCGGVLGSSPAACQPRGGTLAVGAICLNDWQCSTGRCSGNPLVCGVCAVSLPEGAACNPSDDQCAPNLVCANSAINPGYPVCQRFAQIGDVCGVCPLGSICGPDQHCAVAPRLGESCDPSVYLICDPHSPAICDGTTATCVAAPMVVQPGDSCDGNTSCAGNCVTQPDGSQLCQPYVEIGQACDPVHAFCGIGLACDQGVCGTCDTAGPAAFQGALPGRPPLLARLPARWRDARLGGLR
jgi:hypothetical protein